MMQMISGCKDISEAPFFHTDQYRQIGIGQTNFASLKNHILNVILRRWHKTYSLYNEPCALSGGGVYIALKAHVLSGGHHRIQHTHTKDSTNHLGNVSKEETTQPRRRRPN
jgi:hypothetical protein